MGAGWEGVSTTRAGVSGEECESSCRPAGTSWLGLECVLGLLLDGGREFSGTSRPGQSRELTNQGVIRWVSAGLG